ncbi:hypothetical protein U8607_20095 [Methylobacterium durans]|uniref:hypothetical protein n=1 Tax=Methylobacterium durans TaxID=2202825 RepID=UPI002AFF7165|nr:hypothetical protein [Methylobacterium durans]MEA1834398.1 hypothetical protein [Methylobacterium durans]
MTPATIAMNNEVLRLGSERLLRQLHSEGLRYRLWVTGTARGSTVHLRIPELGPEMRDRIIRVLQGRGARLDIEDARVA